MNELTGKVGRICRCHRYPLVINDDAALVTYRVAITALINGAEHEMDALATSVYAREGGQWRSVFHQQTAL